MNRVLISSVFLFGILLTGCEPEQNVSTGSAQEKIFPETSATVMPSPYEAQTTTQASLLSEPNWAILFAGHDLDSFNSVGDAEWNIIDDYVEASGNVRSFLVTKGHYTNFLLHAEFWPGPGTNSGIFIRNDDPDVITAEGGYEINIRDLNEENPQNQSGSIVNHVPPASNFLSENQWNTYQIEAQGDRILVRLNDTVSVDAELEAHQSGPIAFQINGGLIRWRNIRIRPL